MVLYLFIFTAIQFKRQLHQHIHYLVCMERTCHVSTSTHFSPLVVNTGNFLCWKKEANAQVPNIGFFSDKNTFGPHRYYPCLWQLHRWPFTPVNWVAGDCQLFSCCLLCWVTRASLQLHRLSTSLPVLNDLRLRPSFLKSTAVNKHSYVTTETEQKISEASPPLAFRKKMLPRNFILNLTLMDWLLT